MKMKVNIQLPSLRESKVKPELVSVLIKRPIQSISFDWDHRLIIDNQNKNVTDRNHSID